MGFASGPSLAAILFPTVHFVHSSVVYIILLTASDATAGGGALRMELDVGRKKQCAAQLMFPEVQPAE